MTRWTAIALIGALCSLAATPPPMPPIPVAPKKKPASAPTAKGAATKQLAFAKQSRLAALPLPPRPWNLTWDHPAVATSAFVVEHTISLPPTNWYVLGTVTGTNRLDFSSTNTQEFFRVGVIVP